MDDLNSEVNIHPASEQLSHPTLKYVGREIPDSNDDDSVPYIQTSDIPDLKLDPSIDADKSMDNEIETEQPTNMPSEHPDAANIAEQSCELSGYQSDDDMVNNKQPLYEYAKETMEELEPEAFFDYPGKEEQVMSYLNFTKADLSGFYASPSGWRTVNKPGTQFIADPDVRWCVVNVGKNEVDKNEDGENGADENPDAMYEDVGLDRNYFDPDYFLQHTGQKTPQWSVASPKAKANPNPDPEHSALDDGKKIPVEKKAEKNTGKPPKKLGIEISAKDNEKTNDPAPETSVDDVAPEKQDKKQRAYGYTDEESAWLCLYYEKIKAVHNNGDDITISSEHWMTEAFNELFVGKTFKNAYGQSLSPRKARSVHALSTRAQRGGKVTDLRKEVETLLGDKMTGVWYIPVITEDEIQDYILNGTVALDDVNDETKNSGLKKTEQDAKRNEKARKGVATKKRKRDAEEAAIPTTPKTPTFPEDADSLKESTPPKDSAPSEESTPSEKSTPSKTGKPSLNSKATVSEADASIKGRPKGKVIFKGNLYHDEPKEDDRPTKKTKLDPTS